MSDGSTLRSDICHDFCFGNGCTFPISQFFFPNPVLVSTHFSRLLYKVLREGSEEGKGKKAQINTPCKCHYAGTLVDGTEFDSSYKRGAVSSQEKKKGTTTLSYYLFCFRLVVITHEQPLLIFSSALILCFLSFYNI